MGLVRTSFPLLALVTLVMLVGHYVFMTAGPHDPDASRAAEDDSSAIHCHIPDGARLAAPVSIDVETAGLTSPSWTEADASRVIALVAWDAAPGQPPDTRRALLQVFLN
jgi:hypothetical protein